jgi:tetratricopeptide (TPR) repeat protein
MSVPSAEEHKSQGDSAYRAGKFEKAVSLYSESLACNSDNHVVLSNRAAAYLKCKQWKAALKDAERCILLAPEWHKAHYRKACALYKLNKFLGWFLNCFLLFHFFSFFLRIV